MGKIEEFGSDAVALNTIRRFIEEFDKNGESWQKEYYNKLKNYRNDPKKQEQAKTKLTAYYDILEQEKYRIREAYTIIKNRYDSLMQSLKKKMPEITVPAR